MVDLNGQHCQIVQMQLTLLADLKLVLWKLLNVSKSQEDQDVDIKARIGTVSNGAK